MFKTAERGLTISEREFDRRAPNLRIQLIEAQQALRKTDRSVLIVLAGVDGAGKSEFMQLMNEWLDPRWIENHAYPRGRAKEDRPEFARFWRDLPPRGQIGVYLSAWYSGPLLDRVYRRIGKKELNDDLERIADFECMLAADGALILKYWFHLGKKAQRRRLAALEKTPARHWQVTKDDWRNWRSYGAFVKTAETIIRSTRADQAPWRIVDGTDERHRSLVVMNDIRERLLGHLRSRVSKPRRSKATAVPNVLATLDLSKTLSRTEYAQEAEDLRWRLHDLYLRAKKRKIATMVAFEGPDSAGKGGAIKRLTACLDPRDYHIFPFAAPTDEERAHHYLWRFWRTVPADGRIAIYDRSWYGRVLVERVEELANEAEWRRAYGEINAFESELTRHGIVLVKFWLHISLEEQKQRFDRRAKIPFKRWKLTDDDWRNRAKWYAYSAAANEMLARTSSDAAPWTLVEANSKPYARLKVIRTLCEVLKERL